LKMAIEIVDLPIKNGGSFHSYVSHYQRVTSLGGLTLYTKLITRSPDRS
jgi:hypothetical protein